MEVHSPLFDDSLAIYSVTSLALLFWIRLLEKTIISRMQLLFESTVFGFLDDLLVN
jgi:hypothetical protein